MKDLIERLLKLADSMGVRTKEAEDLVREAADGLARGEKFPKQGFKDFERANKAERELAEVREERDELKGVLRRIEKRAAIHPEDTPEDHKRNLRHCEAYARKALTGERKRVTEKRGCPFDPDHMWPRDEQPEPDEPCPVCGDYGDDRHIEKCVLPKYIIREE